MESKLKNPWEIENIQFYLDKEIDFLNKFTIYDDSNLIQSRIFKIGTTDDFIGEIKNSKIDTGIMISSMQINNLSIYLFILDNKIFIIKRLNLPQFQEYFNEHLNSLMFMTAECKDSFLNAISLKNQNSEQNDQLLNEEVDVNIMIKKEIIRCTIKKSQYRTIKMRQELLPDKYNSKNDSNYKLDDFFQIQFQGFRLYYNSRDQILNVLKFYTDEKRFNHEIDFYHQIENTFPFIRKIFGIIKQKSELPIIILEYIEGKRLDKFILSEKEINFNTKIKIIEEILFSVYYAHSNGFYLRDLKPANIIIDFKNDAMLIDFDYSKEMYLSNDDNDENTCNIGDPVFVAPEQRNSNTYTYKVDSYSVGMIIHFIITKQKYNFIYDNQEYELLLHTYEKCFEISPISRPCISFLIANIVFDDNNKIKRANKIILPHIIKQLEKYESIFKKSDKHMYESSYERSYLQYFLGFIYYFENYVSLNSDKSIHYLTLSANQNNSGAQYYLGEIYYLGEYISRDINKSIHYLTLSANQNNSSAQYYLGEIYYLGKYISCDVYKSIHYLTLSVNQNNSDAQYYLGEIYYLGEYISRDINKSIHYLTLSANQNNSYAQCFLGEIYYKGEYISRDINKSIHYLTLSANQNNSDAQYLLGEIYYLGEYISRDINKSIHYLTLSANQNDSDAQCILGKIYYDGKYIEKDIKKSIHYFKESSCFYNSVAKNYLGIIYKNGDGVEKNIYFAKIYFKEAIKQKEESYSMYNLARIYYFGIDHKRKIPKAITHLEQASKKQLFIADLFLFYIFSNCDDATFLNTSKSQQYLSKYQYNIVFFLWFKNINNLDKCKNIQIFLRNYDLTHSFDYTYDLCYFLLNGKFYDWKKKNDNNAQINNNSLRKDANSDFYKGFNEK